MSNRRVFLAIAILVLFVTIVTVITASPDEHPLKFGP
jgi:hypothetical protein